MSRTKGQPKTGGRQKGTPNKMTQTIRAALEEALNRAGGVEYLLRQSEENPQAFMTLLGKIIPQQVHNELTGANGGPIQNEVRINLVRPKQTDA